MSAKTIARMQRSARQLVCVAALVSVALVSVAAPAFAATLGKVRVGRHPTFTRVVFEFDAPAGYQIERRAGADATELIVTLNAASRSRKIVTGSPLVASVLVDSGVDRSVARIRLKDPGLRLKEMILSNPPRLVLDVMGRDLERKPSAVVEHSPPPTPKQAIEREMAKKPEAVAVVFGATDGNQTEVVSGDIGEGQQIVVGIVRERGGGGLSGIRF